MSKVSVIVPIYNTEIGYLRNCIASILSQDHKDIELLLIDDGSKNGTGYVCREYAGADERVKFFEQGNLGVSVARNRGLDEATGDYVLFVDSDDFISPGIVEQLTKEMDELTADVLFFGYCTSYTNRELARVIKRPDLTLFDSDTLQKAILNANPRLGPLEVGAPWGKLIRRSVIEKAHLRFVPGLKKGQDTVFTLNLLEYCRCISYLPVAGYHYRVSGTSISHRFSRDMIPVMEKTLGAYADFIERFGKGAAFRQSLLNKYYRVLTGEYMELYFTHPDNDAPPEDMRREFEALCEKEPYKSAIAALDTKTLTGMDKLIYSLVKKKKTVMLWRVYKSLRLAKKMIVKEYDK